MKRKRHTTADKVHILREADRERSIAEVCQAHNIAEVTFHRWKKDLGLMSIAGSSPAEGSGEGKQRDEENVGRSPAAKRVLEAVCEKKL